MMLNTPSIHFKKKSISDKIIDHPVAEVFYFVQGCQLGEQSARLTSNAPKKHGNDKVAVYLVHCKRNNS